MTDMTVREALSVLLARAIPGRWISVHEVRFLTGRHVSRNAVSKVARTMRLEARYGRLGGYRRRP
jgi:hypothetical protein